MLMTCMCQSQSSQHYFVLDISGTKPALGCLIFRLATL